MRCGSVHSVQYAEDVKQDDQTQGNAENPEDESSAHSLLLLIFIEALPRLANTTAARWSLTKHAAAFTEPRRG
jgi:hypothetical protein